jgi:hypothetical protein
MLMFMSFFTPTQRKVLLILWPLVLTSLYVALSMMKPSGEAALASFFVILPMQVTWISYIIFGIVFLLIWLYGGRKQDMRDYAIIMLMFGLIFTFLLRDAPLDYWQSL